MRIQLVRNPYKFNMRKKETSKADCQITGNLKVKGDIRIDGNVEGNILATGAVIVGQGANIKANIEGKTVILAGEAHGDVKSYDLLELA